MDKEEAIILLLKLDTLFNDIEKERYRNNTKKINLCKEGKQLINNYLYNAKN